MFELRLLRVNHNADRPKLAVHLEGHARPLPYVLQYRTQEGETIYPDKDGSWVRWSEWRDVPTVTEQGRP